MVGRFIMCPVRNRSLAPSAAYSLLMTMANAFINCSETMLYIYQYERNQRTLFKWNKSLVKIVPIMMSGLNYIIGKKSIYTLLIDSYPVVGSSFGQSSS